AIYIFLIILISGVSCTEDFLDIKPDKSTVVPATLSDMQALLDYDGVMNSNTPGMGELSSDAYYNTYDRWNTLTSPYMKNGYIWAKEIWEGQTSIDWNNRYQQAYYANVVLENLAKMDKPVDSELYDRIEGSALFFRAFAFHQLAQLFCEPYNQTGSNNGPGTPLRLTSDLNVPVTRATVKETYDQILADLLESIELLPESDSYKTRPVKASAHAFLSRVYLSMQDYDNALVHAEAAITPSWQLINYNTLIPSAAYPMTRDNSEVLFQCRMTVYTNLSSSRLIVDSLLYKSYENNDIRKTAWFKTVTGNKTYKGSYDGSSQFFNGLALDEIYLTKAECLARKGRVEDALIVLNDLISTRYLSGTYVPYS
ncbi:RagB/SusD family nutrient uptake outer membrane protein, partial [bacterium]|nr:RagB/SusD family nutrient uptake outer membrane protein [bacterium]